MAEPGSGGKSWLGALERLSRLAASDARCRKHRHGCVSLERRLNECRRVEEEAGCGDMEWCPSEGRRTREAGVGGSWFAEDEGWLAAALAHSGLAPDAKLSAGLRPHQAP